MVTVVGFAKRQRTDGQQFIALILQGGLEMVKSKQTDQYYCTVRKCSISSTFDEPTARMMIGEKIPGSIQKLTCENYSYVVKESGEVLNLDFRWAYLPEGASLEEAVFEGEPQLHEVKPEKKPVFLRI